ncbi:MAG: hypothetical protein ACNA76_02615 [Anaerosomatales bacterium]
MTHRDKTLGDALFDGGAPEHDQEFFARLAEGMDAIDAELEAGVVTHVDPVRPRQGTRRPRSRLVAFGTAAAAVAAGVAIVLALGPAGVVLPGGGRVGPEVASAAEVTARVRAAVQGISVLAGDFVLRWKDSPHAPENTMRWQFEATAAGDIRMRGTNTLNDGTELTEALAYSSAVGIERRSSETDGIVVLEERRGLAAGPPDPSPSEWVLQRRLGMVVRALADAEEATVTETTYDGRPAWLLETSVPVSRIADHSPDWLEVTVDRETGFPVRVVETREGALVREMRLENLRTDPELPDGSFELEFPPDAAVFPVDHGFVRIGLDQVAAIAGYAPLIPAHLPEGFELDVVTVSETSQATGREGMNPESRGVTSMVYRRGFDRMIISTRLVGDDPSAWSDPLSSGEGFIDDPERIEIPAGTLAGGRAELMIDPLVVPHLWALNETFVVTVSGDLSRDEFVDVARSLEQ